MTYSEATVLIDDMIVKLNGVDDMFGIPPDDLKAVNAERSSNSALLTFTAGDTVIDGVVFASTAGVMLRRKVGSAPETIIDGDLINDFHGSELHAYQTTPFIDPNLEAGKTYYYRFYPYTSSKVYNFHGNIVSVAIPGS